jgi:hypothetical protein
MFARPATLGILGAIVFALPTPSTPTFSLSSAGAVRLRAAGHEARYGLVPAAVAGRPTLTLTLGDAGDQGALHLSLPVDHPPAPGRYAVRPNQDGPFHAAFMAGTAEHPLGWFEGESGWVTITDARDGRIAGAFEIEARGFLGTDPADERRLVTVRGSFDAAGDSTVTTIASAQ